MTEALRTPDDRFRDLPGWDHQPSYVADLPGYEGLRAHYVDLGPRAAADTYLLLHGEPTWAYLYRKMIPVFLAAGGRVVAPDFFGFGRSDKPVEQAVYSFDFHRDYLLRLVERLDLTNITLVVQDWGGLLGLTLPMDAGFVPRLSRLLAMNTGLAVGTSPGKGFEDWRAYVAAHPDLAVGGLLKRSVPTLSEAEVAVYDAPFPDASYKAGVRAFPQLVMTEPDMPGVEISRAAQHFWSQWEGPSFLAVGAQDPVLGVPAMDRLRRIVRGAPMPLVLADAGHFVQEHGDVVARAALVSFGEAAHG
ncbi:haloalkane dehalogenase [Actinoplanes sp. KI2]|uniref:haloalkane dehalogenase n=1 Tax=Actinoplanes sp. KI2 TaxID=2983315 RepID=UPI0021D5BCCA|nr:haloalkane dehalogenase [Actinoplanes sp. KI2]MCU7723963.1 haloalkane dehalogenase [Actinoplanes sp. KI2]